MPEDQAQAEIQNQTGSGAEGEAEPKETPAANSQQTPTEAREVADVDEYHRMLDDAMSPAPKDEASEQGKPAETQKPKDEGTAESEQSTETEEKSESPEGTAEGDDTPADTDPEPKKEFRPRLNTFDEREQEAILLKKTLAEKGEKISLAEAEKRVNAKYGVTESSQQQQGQTQQPRTVADVRAEIQAKEAEADKAADELDVRKVNQLNREIRQLEKEATAIDAREEAQFNREVNSSQAKAVGLYPMIADEKHAQHAAIKAESDRIWQAMEKSENPLIYDANAPFRIAQMAANNLGIAPVDPDAPRKPATPKASTPATPKPQAVTQRAVGRPNPAVTPASGGARTTTTGQPAEAFREPLSKLDYDDVIAELTQRQ